MKYLYWCDCLETMNKEAKATLKKLREYVSFTIKLEATDINPFNNNISFDVLLFDWGSNRSFSPVPVHCRDIYNHAQSHPNNIYVMLAQFTRAAMRRHKAKRRLESEKIKNVFLNIKSALPLIREWE